MYEVIFWCSLITLAGIYCLAIYVGVVIRPELTVMQPSAMDRFRREMREKGLVLHLPSYHKGVEAYCDPSFQFSECSSAWLKYPTTEIGSEPIEQYEHQGY